MTLEVSTAWAHKVASYLKTRHGATKVLLFGSAVSGSYVPGHSDIDLYFEGVPVDKESYVVGDTFCRFPDLPLDLIPAGHAPFTLTREALATGTPI